MIGNQFVINLFIRFQHNVMTEHTIKSISMVRSIPLIPFLNEKYNVYKMHIIHKISSEYAKKYKPNFFSANKLKGNNTMKNAKINSRKDSLNVNFGAIGYYFSTIIQKIF